MVLTMDFFGKQRNKTMDCRRADGLSAIACKARASLSCFVSAVLCAGLLPLMPFPAEKAEAETSAGGGSAASRASGLPTQLVNGDFDYPWIDPQGASGIPGKSETDFLYINPDGNLFYHYNRSGKISNFSQDKFGWRSKANMLTDLHDGYTGVYYKNIVEV